MADAERRSVDAEVRVERRSDDAGNETRVLSGLAAVFYDGTPGTEARLFDDLYERVDPGAFDEALPASDVRALYNHNANALLGRSTAGTLRLAVDQRGLRYEVDVPDTTIGRDVAESVRRGDVSGSSYAYVPSEVVWSIEERDGREVEVRTITKVSPLLDVGPVTYPAYESTEASMRSAGVQSRDALRVEAREYRSKHDHKSSEDQGAARRRALILAELDMA